MPGCVGRAPSSVPAGGAGNPLWSVATGITGSTGHEPAQPVRPTGYTTRAQPASEGASV